MEHSVDPDLNFISSLVLVCTVWSGFPVQRVSEYLVRYQEPKAHLSSRLKINSNVLDFNLTKFLEAAMICFANSLDPDQDRQNVGPDVDQNCLTLR